MRTITLLAALVFASVAYAGELSPAQQQQVLAEAQEQFDRGVAVRQSNPADAEKAFRSSAEKFQLLADSGIVNGKLYYNLANAWLESGELGKAIASYRRAEALMPTDGNIQANLAVARSKQQTQIAPAGDKALMQSLFFWHYMLSTSTRFWLAISLWIAFWAILVVRVFVRKIRWRYALVPVLILALGLGASTAVSLTPATVKDGVITADDVIVRKGNGEGFEPQFLQKLNEGVEFSVLEQRGDWLHIQLPDAKTGWIRAAQAELI